MYVASVYGLWTCHLKSGECSVAFGNKKGTQQWLNQMITDVSSDQSQQLMVLTHPDGVTIYDTKQDSLYFIRQSGDIVKGMTRDHNGTYWLCTSSGNVASILPERQPNQHITYIQSLITPSVGMPQFYFNGDAMTCSPQGKVLMGGTEGYMSFNPSQLLSAKHTDRDLTISEIAIGDSLLNERTSTVSLRHDAAYLTVKFFSGSLEGVQRTRYAYRLLGQMSDWATTDHNYVSFHSLPPGDYTLQLCVCREDGTMSTPRELLISVAPPFYRTLPMYVVYAVIVAAIVLLLWYRIRKRQQERSAHEQALIPVAEGHGQKGDVAAHDELPVAPQFAELPAHGIAAGQRVQQTRQAAVRAFDGQAALLQALLERRICLFLRLRHASASDRKPILKATAPSTPLTGPAPTGSSDKAFGMPRVEPLTGRFSVMY